MEVIEEKPADDGKAVAILSYIPIIGLLIALILHNSRKSSFGAFHLKQAIGLHVTWLIVVLVGYVIQVVPFIGWLITKILYLAVAVLGIIGLINAVNGRKSLLPVLGESFEKVFSGLD